MECIEFPQWTRNFRPPRARTFSIIPLTLTIGFFRLKTPGHFRDFLGDHFARVESSGNPNLTMFILHFHVFLHVRPPKIMKNPRFCRTLPNLVPWDHAQMIERKILCRIDSFNESSVRPNPTLVIIKLLFNFCHF